MCRNDAAQQQLRTFQQVNDYRLGDADEVNDIGRFLLAQFLKPAIVAFGHLQMRFSRLRMRRRQSRSALLGRTSNVIDPITLHSATPRWLRLPDSKPESRQQELST